MGDEREIILAEICPTIKTTMTNHGERREESNDLSIEEAKPFLLEHDDFEETPLAFVGEVGKAGV